MIRSIKFYGSSYDEFVDWMSRDKKLFKRLHKMIKEVSRTPFEGIGKPEALRGNFSGYWSRRIDEKHRLIYKVENETIIITSCYGHYND